jgi:hypothetical protein
MADSDYTYNFPTTSTSLLTNKPSHRRRSRSPTAFVLPHSKHHATYASDIARLLDPSYSSPSYASSAPYVDRHGDLHDPDYRHFPAVTPPPLTHVKATRPRWVINSNDDVFAVDEDDQDLDSFSTRLDTRRSPDRRHRDSVSTYRPASYSSSFPHSFLTPPTSLESNDTVLGDVDEFPFDDEKDKKCPIAAVKKASGKSRSSRLSKAPIQTEKVQPEEERHIIDPSPNDPPPQDYIPTDYAQDPEWTSVPSFSSGSRKADSFFSNRPTCTQSLRRQWQSVNLSFRLRVFRFKRRVRRVIKGY